VFSDTDERLNVLLEAHGLTPGSTPPDGFDPGDLCPSQPHDNTYPILSVALDVSGNCNMACRYCAEAASQPKRKPMTTETMETAVRLLDVGAHPEIRCSVRIGSGEPLMALPLLKRLHTFLEHYDAPIDVFLTTNGTLIDEKTADWLAATGWRIKISLDGPESVHDAMRQDRSGKPTHARVVMAVEHLVARCPERISVAAVLCRGADPETVFQAISTLGVRRIELLPVAYVPQNEVDDIRPAMEDVAAYIRFLITYAQTIAAEGPENVPALVRFEECVRRLMGYGNAVLPCGAGRSFLCVDADGSLYPCFRFAGVADYCLGNMDGGPDRLALEAFRGGAGRNAEQRSGCNICWAASVCGGLCFSVAEFFGPVNGFPEARQCAYKLADARVGLRLVDSLRKDDPVKLMGFLPVGSIGMDEP
jgi:uncharacterized protein